MATSVNDRLPSGFSIDARWIDNEIDVARAHDRTLARLSISAASSVLTSYKSDKGDVGDEVEIPAYPLAEWLASNWWSLLFEPRKGDWEDNDSFKTRHWLGTARAGFALPDVWIVPTGDRVEIVSRDTYLRHARLTFTADFRGEVLRSELESGLRTFMQSVMARLSGAGISDTLAQELWGLIEGTDVETAAYCQLVGALGLNPYDANDDVDGILDKLSEQLPFPVLFDLCQAADERSFRMVAGQAGEMFAHLGEAQTFDATQISQIKLPAERLDAAAWRWGLDVAEEVRRHFGKSSREPAGGEDILREIGIDFAGGGFAKQNDNSDTQPVTGALDSRERKEVRLALPAGRTAHKKFTAARGVFMSIAFDSNIRLITGARTRDQQASRAFAAEMLAPSAYLRSRSSNGLSSYRVAEIAEELDVSPAVVRYQAQNNHIHVYDAY